MSIKVAIKTVYRKGRLHIPITEFRHHCDQIVFGVLSKEREIVVTKYGEPSFAVHPTTVFGRISFDFPMAEFRAGHVELHSHTRSGQRRGSVKITQFFGRGNHEIIKKLNAKDWDEILVTWHGWPLFAIRRTRLTRGVQYPSLGLDVQTLRSRRKDESAETNDHPTGSDGNDGDDGNVIPLADRLA